MKPILDWTKSKAEAYVTTFSFRPLSWNFRDCLLWKALRRSAAVRCDTERDAQGCSGFALSAVETAPQYVTLTR